MAEAWLRRRALIYTAIHTGMRASELRGLPWSAVDLKAGKIHVTQKADENGVASDRLKSRSAKRTIKIPPGLRQVLSEWKMRTGNRTLAFGTDNDKPQALANIFNRAWKPLQLMTGVTFNFHALRHFHASMLIRSNANPKEVQAEISHSSIKITYDPYGHLFSDDDINRQRAERAEKLEALLR